MNLISIHVSTMTSKELKNRITNALMTHSHALDPYLINKINQMLETIEVRSYMDIDEQTYNVTNIGTRKPKYKYPLSNAIVERFENDSKGLASTDSKVIYICSNVHNIELLEVVIHELCHITNKDISYCSQHNKFHHEFNSHIQEFYLTNPTTRFTRSKKRDITNYVNDYYKTNFDTNNVSTSMMKIMKIIE